MGVWYAHRLATTFVLSELPTRWPRDAKGDRPADIPAYYPANWLKAKGWPTFERAVSGMIKRASSESWRRLVDPTDPRRLGWTPGVPAPLHPREFAAKLARMVFTNGKRDCPTVATLYADTLFGALGNTKVLEFKNCRWQDEDAVQLAAVLQYAHKLEILDLMGNQGIGEEGLRAIIEVLRDARNVPYLKRLCFTVGKSAEVAAAELLEVCDGRVPRIHLFQG